MELGEFTLDAPCPKCGFEDVLVQFRRGRAHIDCRLHEFDAEEHLHRVCVRCDYTWYERTLMEDV